ncbi:helix-turn-helix domain-containing protein [Paeniclostridium sordellii]|uniref:helix-turn-helix domain-containing protein n=1 Tax=Paraclostridium sordellii TaxID=1505 RepID=UPI0005E4EB62|nr:helix-turn-helix transcriptional regulator [Paeniclostridium sordellii]MDU4412814.1 helix-turn-helix transcriptional regulator [Paeniclostridium sordellii]MRZ29589.1 helix-turn-helix domain-containing protein [Paeniclostridium sordellii]MVO73645.1 helix-turn-helix domain-containing protein [Paeniclostridium sordellii]CEQ06454.1 DNA-binding protein [[Clostridium] sordellii] [Paeniclostridium sordellii]
MKENLKLSNKLKNARLELNLSQEYVAKQLSISRSAISEIENGKRKVSTDELKLFSNIYGVSIDELLYDKQPDEVKMFARAFSELSQHDKNEIMNLIEFKKNYKNNSKVRYV